MLPNTNQLLWAAIGAAFAMFVLPMLLGLLNRKQATA